MDRFVLSLPRGNAKRKISPSRSGMSQPKKQSTMSMGGTQMFLDLGQKSFGATKQCQKCSMFYIVGDFDDEKRHKSFCDQSKKPLLLKGVIDEKQVVDTFQNEEGVCGEDRIVLIRGVESSKQKIDAGSLNQILETVQAALGSTLDLMESAEESCLLFVRKKEILGCVIIEPVSRQALVPITKTMKTTDVNVNVEAAAQSKSLRKFGRVSAANVVTPVIDNKHRTSVQPSESNAEKENVDPPTEEETMGVKLVWVSDQARRKGVARKLVDSARTHFRFGTIIKREHVAFSQPTDQGLAFALSYTQKSQIWSFC